MPEIERSIRYRITISRGMKGGVSFEATVDMQGYEIDDVLIHSDALMEELEKRYPISKFNMNQ